MDKGDLERIKHMRRYCEDIASAINRFGNSYEAFSQDTDFLQLRFNEHHANWGTIFHLVERI
jgi:hypothetical protein